jgi:hypothetical protein
LSPNHPATTDGGSSLVRLVTVPEVARRIGFPASRVQQQIRSGSVPAYSVAGQVIVLRAEHIDLVRQKIVTTLTWGPAGPGDPASDPSIR